MPDLQIEQSPTHLDNRRRLRLRCVAAGPLPDVNLFLFQQIDGVGHFYGVCSVSDFDEFPDTPAVDSHFFRQDTLELDETSDLRLQQVRDSVIGECRLLLQDWLSREQLGPSVTLTILP